MVYENIIDFIKETGFRTLDQIKNKFKDSDPEILETYLDYLIQKGSLNYTEYQSPAGKGEMYLLPFFKNGC